MLVPTIDGTPVLLPCHDDVEIGITTLHYHVDPRFTPLDRFIALPALPLPDIVWEEREPIPGLELNFTSALWVGLLWRGAVKSVGDGIRCPHKGYLLEGCAICPMHGLPNPLPDRESLVIEAVDDGGAVLGTVRLMDCEPPTITMVFNRSGILSSVVCLGRRIHDVDSYHVVFGDLLRLTLESTV